MLIVVIVFVALFGPLIAPYDPTKNDYSVAVQPPSRAHPFGTDKFEQIGEDLAGSIRIVNSVRVYVINFHASPF